MSAGLSAYGATRWSQALFNIQAPPSTLYLALATSEPGKGWNGDILDSVEPSDSAYARQAIPNDGTFWQQNNNYVTNNQIVVYGTPTQDWGVITHYVLCSAATSGEIYMYASFVRPLRLTTSYYVTVPLGAITIALDTFSGSYNA